MSEQNERKGAWSSVPIDMRWHYGCPPLPLKKPGEKSTKKKMIFWLTVVAVVFYLLLYAAIAWSMHGDWTDHYKSVNGTPCCHLERDCLKTEVRIIEMNDEVVIAEVGGEVITLSRKSVHLSEEQNTYRCRIYGKPEDKVTSANTRCIFYAIGS